MEGRARILCVDDEPNVLEGLGLHLRRRFDVKTATSGQAGLELLQSDGGIAVVISDMRMPGMDGAAFLAAVRQVHPNTVRMLLTGQADMQSAIAAINHGQIFRFLTKPCPPAELLAATQAAVEQHRLITAERVLLEQTLHGSIKTLADVLALSNPVAFGRATRLKARVTDLANELGLAERWQVEMAALLSQLGAVSLPVEVVDKLHHGRPLTSDEEQMLERVPELTEQLLANIPRLETVRAILARYSKPQRPGEPLDQDPAKRTAELGARMLRVAVDFDTLEAQGNAPARVVDTLRGRTGTYDEKVMAALAAVYGARETGETVRELPLSALAIGMVFAEDVRLVNGALLCARGYEVTSSFLGRAKNFKPGTVVEPLRVVVKG